MFILFYRTCNFMSCLKYHFIIFIINVFFDRLGSGGHGQCNHVGGILFAIEDFNRQGLQNRSEPVTCTSRLCAWNVPRNSKVAAKPVDDINIVKYRYGKDNRTSVKSSVYDPRAPCDRVLNKAKLNSMLVKLSQHLPSSSLFLFHDIKPSLDSQNVIVDSTCECVPLNCIEMVELTSEHDDMDLPFNDDYDIATKKFKSMIDIYEERITDNDVERIERLSRGQDNTFWRELKQEKLTASNFKAAAKRKVEPDKLLKQIMYKIEETTNVSALQYGHMHEDNAINDYIKYKHSQGNTGLTVWKVGTYISKIRPGLGASLDRMVYDPLAHCKKGGLEIKCPYSKQGMTIEEACQDKNFCMTLKPGMPTLKIGHQYYYQVQGQMYVSCLQWVDFVVWFGADNLYIQRIVFDKQWWHKEALPKLDYFYRLAFLPEVLTRRVKRGVRLYNHGGWQPYTTRSS